MGSVSTSQGLHGVAAFRTYPSRRSDTRAGKGGDESLNHSQAAVTGRRTALPVLLGRRSCDIVRSLSVCTMLWSQAVSLKIASGNALCPRNRIQASYEDSDPSRQRQL